MKKSVLIFILSIVCVLNKFELLAQTCGTRQLDPRVASFLKMIGNEDLTIEQFCKIPMAQLRFAGPPSIPYPAADVKRIKITADSIPVLIFNPAHASSLPIIINYHGGGFFLPF